MRPHGGEPSAYSIAFAVGDGRFGLNLVAVAATLLLMARLRWKMAAKGVTFRPLAVADLPRLHSWLNADHVQRWIGREPSSLEDVVSEFTEHIERKVPITSFIVLLDERPVGWVAWEHMDDWPEGKALYGITEPGVANCDILLGEPDAADRGLGPVVIRALLEQHIFADPRVAACVIDPYIGNTIAIRAYEKAGFRFLRVALDDGGGSRGDGDGDGRALYLMELRREDFGSPPPAPNVWLRPARLDELFIAAEIDDDASRMYADAGVALQLDDQHPFAISERARWAKAAAGQRLLFACGGDGRPIGFSAVNMLDGHPHLDQVSVRREAMRQGIGRMLVERAIRWSTREGELWLTTYDHVPWNRAWYERLGFKLVPEPEQGPELRRTLAAERAALPAPEHRVALRYRHH